MKSAICCAIVLTLSIAGTSLGDDDDYYGPSTVGESYSRGLGNVIQAQGQANLANSQAAINLQDAYSKGIDNNVKAVNAYYEKKDIYHQHKQVDYYKQGQHRSAYVARNTLQPLSTQDFDRTSGRVSWPAIMEQPQYDKYRKPLDELFRKRAQQGALSSDEFMIATNACKSWRMLLNTQMDDYSKDVLHQMVRFILNMEHELRDNLG